jgi:hypothetical protein
MIHQPLVLAFQCQHAFALGTVIALAESGPDLGGRWPSRLVATATADCLSKSRSARHRAAFICAASMHALKPNAMLASE